MSGRGLRIGVALAIGVAAICAAVPAASAGALLPSCGTTSHPFTAWGDSGSYCAFPNLGFEEGTSGWTVLGKASVVAANEPWDVSGPGTHALRLGPGASALSAPLPVSLLDPWLRFFAESTQTTGALDVHVIFRGLLGNLTGFLNYGSLAPNDFSSWQATQRISSLLALPLGTSAVQVLITNASRSGSWQVDDFYLDPCVSRFGG